MIELVRHVSEGLARKTSRRGLFGRGAEVVTGVLLGAAAGSLMRPDLATAGLGTVCIWTVPCPCDGCNSTGVCAKPCILVTGEYASGCWATFSPGLQTNVTCCDCDCRALDGTSFCWCSSDYHNNPEYCPPKQKKP